MKRKYLGSFAQEEEAAKAVAKRLRQPRANLVTYYSAPEATHQRTDRSVYLHCRDHIWQVKIGGKVWVSFVDHADALAVAVKKAGLSQHSCSYIRRMCANPSRARGMQSRNKQNSSGISTVPTQE